ncbi:TIM barrel protein [Candidatus Poribacteria bacterium]|nr:TIM barrel protein [Candidatus Poribacteria bacterium]
MLRLSACIESLFKGPYEERIRRVASAGLKAFEFWGWGNKDIDGIRRIKDELGLEVATFVCDTGGPLVDPANREKLIEGAKRSVEIAQKLDCKTLIVTTGNEIQGVSRGEQHESIVEGLKAVAPIVEEAGVTLVLEPLNTLVNHKGYYLWSSAEGFQIVDEVNSPNVKLLYDIYHQQIMEGNLIATITSNIGKIGHFHVADVPGRHEPGTGEINYRNVFKAIAEAGYDGFIGLEYWPTGEPEETLKEVMEIASSL